MIYPVRVPAHAATFIAVPELHLAEGHPLTRDRCPVCDRRFGRGPIAMVYVGAEPGARRGPRHMAGAAVPVHTRCTGPSSHQPGRHTYLSTACWHEMDDPDAAAHGDCRATCKWCNEPCACPNHPAGDNTTTGAGPAWVDQARDTARRLLAVLQSAGVDVADHDPELAAALTNGPEMFWARGEEQPPGQWRPVEDWPRW